MWILIATGLLSAFFLFASSIKIFGWPEKIFQIQLEMFISYGLNREFMRLVGVVELFGAVTIVLKNSTANVCKSPEANDISQVGFFVPD